MNVSFASARGLSLGAGALVAVMAATPISSALQGPEGPGAAQLFGGLPLSFVENRGQWDTPARFVAKRGPMVARLEHNALVVELRDSTNPEKPKALVLRLAFEGASEDVRLEGEGQQPGVRNYFLGNDPEAWRTGVPGFDSVLYRGIQEGIDLRVRDRDGRLEYDLLLAPGADLAKFTVRCEGVEGVGAEPDGSLALQTALGPVRQTPPATWYVLPSGEREPVECRFVLLDEERYGFEIPDRDPGLPVVIDPGIEWSTFLGGTDDDQLMGLAVDSVGLVTVGGRTLSMDFPATPGAHGTSLSGTEDAVVARLDPRQFGAGQLLWATYFGGSGVDRLTRLVQDDAGDVYFVGHTTSDDLPLVPVDNPTDPDLGGVWDAFVAKLDATGSALLYSTYLGGSNADSAAVVVLRAPNEVVVGGNTGSADFPTTPGALDELPDGYGDAFVSLLRLDGTGPGDLFYSTVLGGTGDEGLLYNNQYPGDGARKLMSLTVNAAGDIFATGRTDSTDFPTSIDAYSSTKSGGFDIYVSHIHPASQGLNDLVYSTYLGGSLFDEGQAIELEESGAVVIGGQSASEDFPTTAGAYDRVLAGFTSDAILFRLDPGEDPVDQLTYSTFLGGEIPDATAPSDTVVDLELDGSGGWIAIGATGGSGALTNTFPTTCGAYDRTFNHWWDGFVAHVYPGGNGSDDLLYSTFLGSSYISALHEVVLTSSGPPVEIVTVGYSQAFDFPTTPDAFQPLFLGGPGLGDGVVVRMELAPQWASYCSTAPNSVGPGALIAGSCNASIGDNSFELLATGAVPNQFGLFYYGPEQQQVPFGDGYQCVAPGASGLFRLNPALVIDGSGAVSRLIDFTQPPADAGPGQITAGSTWNFQFWYRDPAGPGGTTFNLSDALSVTFTP